MQAACDLLYSLFCQVLSGLRLFRWLIQAACDISYHPCCQVLSSLRLFRWSIQAVRDMSYRPYCQVQFRQLADIKLDCTFRVKEASLLYYYGVLESTLGKCQTVSYHRTVSCCRTSLTYDKVPENRQITSLYQKYVQPE